VRDKSQESRAESQNFQALDSWLSTNQSPT
jgi:hypothetical protein